MKRITHKRLRSRHSMNNIMRYSQLFFILLISLLTRMAEAQTFKNTATAGFIFLEIPASARNSALGEATIAVSDAGAQGVFVNPAITGFNQREHSFAASYAPWLADTRHLTAAYSYNSPVGVFSASVVNLDFGSMTKTIRRLDQRVYEVVGTFNASALAFGLSYSRMLTDRFSFGATAKYVQESIDIYSASNLLFDGGVLYYTGLGSVRIAATIQNFGVNTKYRNDPFKMPSLLKLGVAGELYDGGADDFKVTGVLEAVHPNDNDERVNAGIEVTYLNAFSLRGGYKFFYDEDSYTVGIGLRPHGFVPAEVDFSLSDFGRLGNVLRFTVQVGI